MDVLALLTDGLSWTSGWEDAWSCRRSRRSPGPSTSWVAPVEQLFRQVTGPLATVDTPGSFLAGRRLVAIDGTTFDLDDSPANDGFFGRPGVNKGERSAFPQARVLRSRVWHPAMFARRSVCTRLVTANWPGR